MKVEIPHLGLAEQAPWNHDILDANHLPLMVERFKNFDTRSKEFEKLPSGARIEDWHGYVVHGQPHVDLRRSVAGLPVHLRAFVFSPDHGGRSIPILLRNAPRDGFPYHIVVATKQTALVAGRPVGLLVADEASLLHPLAPFADARQEIADFTQTFTDTFSASPTETNPFLWPFLGSPAGWGQAGGVAAHGTIKGANASMVRESLTQFQFLLPPPMRTLPNAPNHLQGIDNGIRARLSSQYPVCDHRLHNVYDDDSYAVSLTTRRHRAAGVGEPSLQAGTRLSDSTRRQQLLQLVQSAQGTELLHPEDMADVLAGKDPRRIVSEFTDRAWGALAHAHTAAMDAGPALEEARTRVASVAAAQEAALELHLGKLPKGYAQQAALMRPLLTDQLRRATLAATRSDARAAPSEKDWRAATHQLGHAFAQFLERPDAQLAIQAMASHQKWSLSDRFAHIQAFLTVYPGSTPTEIWNHVRELEGPTGDRLFRNEADLMGALDWGRDARRSYWVYRGGGYFPV